MADVQVALKLPVLRQGSNPESGPTVIEHLQLMLNERGGFPIQRMRSPSAPTQARCQHSEADLREAATLSH